MEFHIARAARQRYGVDEALFNYVGNVIFGDVLASRKLAARMMEVRTAAAAAAGRVPGAADAVNAGALFAMGLIDELSHALVAKYRETVDPDVLREAIERFSAETGPGEVEGLLAAFATEFPNVPVYRGEQTVAEWLRGAAEGLPNREAALEEMLLLWLANVNPAYKAFDELFDDTKLKTGTVYPAVTAKMPEFFAERAPIGEGGLSLLDALRAPMLASPDSLSGQLDFIRENWTEYIGEELRQVLLAMDVLREEEIAIWMRFHPAGRDGGHGADGGPRDWGMLGFAGDEYQGFEDLRTAEERRRAELLARGVVEEPTVEEYEAFSPDQAWMPNVVLIAKSTYVWLEQLSKRYGRHIHRLDQIPQEELNTLAGRGMNGLWLIGLWERSVASQTIKRMMGNHDAVASAYSLRDYRIAEDLGGEGAYEVLRDRARAAGIRLASDMVPNHMGIDSTWVVEHPEWFVQRETSPFPVYRFGGPNLSPDARVEIRIEDHYFDQTDAAVVFQLKDRRNGRTEYVFHGNDGTTFAWNDTAQLDYSKAFVREQVIQTILQVAKLFPIIRFDAAMTLAKKHVQRLWFPLPGEGRSIPSRAENAMTNAEFDALMPNEFWREVVDRVAVEVPGTLLLAEAFWLLEGYFVRTLGMHRVYNSAFMNMLRDEENAKYRSYLKKTIEFDPDILKRYVNFMSNPDERTAVDQFGTGDKYFGCCTLMATMPGLPMFGHGQVEAFTERYGMEYKRARMDETPNEDLVTRHQREIMPLLKNRGLFAESGFFRMYDFNTPFGTDENVFAFSNREGRRRAVILFNNAYGSTRGTIHWSVEQVDKGSGILRGDTLGDAIQLPWEDGKLLAYKDSAAGLEYLRWSRELRHEGLTLDLRGYQYAVLLDWRELQSTAEQPWGELCHALGGAGVRNLEEELARLRLRPVHEALARVLRREHLEALMEAVGAAPGLKEEEDVAGRTVSVAKAEMELPGSKEAPETRAASAPEPEDLPTSAGDEEAEEAPGRAAEEKAANREEDAGDEASLPHWGAAALLPLEEAVASFEEAVRSAGETVGSAGVGAGRTRVSLRLTIAALPVEGRLVRGAGMKAAGVAVLGPAVAWLALRELGGGKRAAEVFDRLHLRAALAGIFKTAGLPGEDAWRGAARVRVLLQHGTSKDGVAALPAAFWKDGEVGWLAGVSESQGCIYLNKERFEEMLAWMRLPELAGGAEWTEQDFQRVEAELQAGCKAAAEAGYELEKFLALREGGGSVRAEGAGSPGAVAAGNDRVR